MSKRNIAEEIFRHVISLPEPQVAELSIWKLARQFGVSRCHISRRFHKEHGMTLAQFIQRRKLLLAERFLLREPRLSIKSLASRIGYADYQYFISRFRAEWGESPGRYRKLACQEPLRAI